MDMKIFVLVSTLCFIKNIQAQCLRPAYIDVPMVPSINLDYQRRIIDLPPPTFCVETDAPLIISGGVLVNGRLPFVGAVEVDGILPSLGQGSVLYRCGRSEIGIIEELPLIY
ncbi:uncharacterized protein LOC121739591 [Aricia agestis]|uniref:uncharacterized protein LOC121739591 n=1 Tax=Aricia agestis TaxID=91739 RepID=UPI001C205CB2|nr:uncharacterized protein LOC121739591 [Aricia agestis]